MVGFPEFGLCWLWVPIFGLPISMESFLHTTRPPTIPSSKSTRVPKTNPKSPRSTLCILVSSALPPATTLSPYSVTPHCLTTRLLLFLPLEPFPLLEHLPLTATNRRKSSEFFGGIESYFDSNYYLLLLLLLLFI